MNVLVLGAGVIGVTTAYALAERGCKVTILDQANSVASGATFGNGAQLSYSFVDPIASFSFLKKMPGLMAGRDPSASMSLTADPHFLRWGMGFVKECVNGSNKKRLFEAIKLAQESETALARWLARVPVSFGYRRSGKLVVTRQKSALSGLSDSVAFKREMGMDVSMFARDECFALYPYLEHQAADIVGGVYAPDDSVGDAKRFTEAIACEAGEKYGVKIKLKHKILSLLTDGERAVGVRTGCGDFTADMVVVCLGVSAAVLLRPYGIKLPILPVKGYSISVPATAKAPKVSITDLDHKMVFAKLHDQLRVAGLSDFGEKSNEINEARIAYMKDTAQKIFPDIGDYSHSGQPWAGLRPMTPGGLPITGASKIKNLYLNTGHGMFGWTFACGSAERLARCVLGPKKAREAA